MFIQHQPVIDNHLQPGYDQEVGPSADGNELFYHKVRRQDTGFVYSKKQYAWNGESAGRSGTLFFQSLAE
jgi:hypothetical protein